MPRQVMVMPWPSKPVSSLISRQASCRTAAAGLQQEERLLAALLDADQLTRLSPGRYRYVVTSPRCSSCSSDRLLRSRPIPHTCMRAVDCELEGWVLSMTSATLEAILKATPRASAAMPLSVSVSQLPRQDGARRALETTGESILKGILVGIKARVGQQLMADFRRWCRETDADHSTLQQARQETAAMQSGGS